MSIKFASEKLRTFHRWIKSAAISKFEELVNLMVPEEFKRKIPYQIMLHLTDKEETDLLKAAKVADVFSRVHRHTSGEKKKPQNVQSSAGSKPGPV
ncbi:putative SCAN domain-containing protein-like 1 [Homarus americanus]|uniref:Putative SCAN domain-containing protein-like 1 n=1 Tax=Homarus americanus TaxID=6706 RepID=A0A8J5JFV8_HOMAM|nr:putative SCAN domain-containing protein-like 1 [Homarus americanus]